MDVDFGTCTLKEARRAAFLEWLYPVGAAVAAAARLDSISVQKAKTMTVTVGGAPSEDPRELRRSSTLKRECAKRGIVLY